MAQLRQRNPRPAPPTRPLSEFLPRTKEPSMLFSLLPSAVQSRLPRLPSLRRSVSMYGISRKRKVSVSRPSSGSSTSSASSGMRTPEQGYTSAMVLSDARNMMADDGVVDYLVESASSDEDTSMPRAGRNQRLELTENKSGIGWKFANQGLSLLSLAVDESSSLSQDPNFGNASFARQLYLHALTYLIRALPTDLTTEEQLSIRSSLPQGIVEPLHLEVNGYAQPNTASDSQRSLLHRTLASTIVQFFILAQFVLPYIKYLLRAAYQYDREHKISEKVFSQSIETVDTLGKAGLSWTGAIYGMGNGKVGQVMTDTAAWFVEGVTGGIHEGVGEGMVIMGAPRRGPGPERRRC
ncbi:hypothetical protein ONS95_001226 [Cadophora gregata]|uniref:uncharacterized protein n=1 Tax=Cadophora gregata TaxID=51156 RepID=UPI0026DBF5AB|nr:uncharacterized protein ONS95_001226 [Cadophora gregata]KAK0129293.1 hypothetical protein ONS95_001226 [Cadophora gregata]